MRRLSALICLLPLLTTAQDLLPESALRFNPSILELGQRSLAVLDTTVWLVNDSGLDLPISGLGALSGRLAALELPLSLAAHDSLQLPLRLDLSDDLDLEDVLSVFAPDVGGLPALPVTAQPRHADPDWAGAANLRGGALKDFLESRVTGHTVFSYSEARQHMFGEYDNVDGQVQCVYTGTWVTTSGIPDPNVMNTEHTWPQSMGAEGDARSDMHHLFPTLNQPNAIRGNLPFGEVATPDWSQGGSLRGLDAGGVTVFEPRDVHKGDGARALCYFALRYGNLSSFLTYQEPTLRAWALADTVSQKERERNDAIDALQHNRNPFIDHMGWLERIASLAGAPDLPPTRLLQLPADSLALATPSPDDSTWLRLPVLNTGNATLLLGYAQSSLPQDLSVQSFPSSLAAGRLGWIELAFHPQQAGPVTVDLTISSNAQNGALRHLALRGAGSGTGVDPPPVEPKGWRLLGAAPNPFNPVTQVSLELDRPLELTLGLYDCRGARVWERREALPAGRSTLPMDLTQNPSGRYWLSVGDGRRAETLPLTLLR